MNRRALLTCAAIAVAAGLTARRLAGLAGTDVPVRADHADRRVAGWRRQRHQHAADRRRAQQADRRPGGRAQQAGCRRRDRPPRDRERQARRLHHRHVQLRRHRAAVSQRAGQHLRRTAAHRILRRRSECACRSATRAASPRSRTMSSAPAQIRARSRTATTSRAARPISAPRSTRSCSTSSSPSVSYAGFGPTVIGLMGGEVDSATVPVPDTIEQHKAGKLKILGVSATERHFMAPEIPTFREQGFDVVVGSWRCIVGPKGIPEDRLRFLENNIIAALKSPDFQAKAKQVRLRRPARRRQGDLSALAGRRCPALSDSPRGRPGEGAPEIGRGADRQPPPGGTFARAGLGETEQRGDGPRIREQGFSRRRPLHGVRPARACGSDVPSTPAPQARWKRATSRGSSAGC